MLPLNIRAEAEAEPAPASAPTDAARIAELQAQLAAARSERDALQRERDVLRGVFACFASFGASLDDVRDAFGDLSSALAAQRASAQQASEQSAQHRADFERTRGELQALFEHIGQAAQRVAELDRRAAGIDEAVRRIRGIAGQTRLLAINAQIEAARAGAAGRGFAVVAEEVGKLSARTQQATVDIASLLLGIRDDTRETRSTMERAGSEAMDCSQRSEQSMRGAQELLERHRAITTAAQDCALLANVEFANIDELIVKLEVYKALFDVSAVRAEDLPDETHCRLGTWYYDGEGRERFAELPGYAALEAPHRAVHVHARGAVAAHRAQRGQLAVTELQAMEQANLEVLHGLRRMLGSAERP